VTKVDVAPAHKLKETLSVLSNDLKSAGMNKVPQSFEVFTTLLISWQLKLVFQTLIFVSTLKQFMSMKVVFIKFI